MPAVTGTGEPSGTTRRSANSAVTNCGPALLIGYSFPPSLFEAEADRSREACRSTLVRVQGRRLLVCPTVTSKAKNARMGGLQHCRGAAAASVRLQARSGA